MSRWIPNNLEGLGSLFQDEFSSYAYVFALLMGFAIVFLLLNPLAPKPAPRRREPEADPEAQPQADARSMPVAPLPAAQPVPSARPMPASGPARLSGAPPQHPRILVVDDSNVVRVKLRRLLEAEGYEVSVAENGVLAEAQLAAQRFSLLITDLEMPEMDGFELIASVHGSLDTEGMPIIAITGHEELQARVHACEGIYGLFKKPWNDRELLRRVAALVQLSETQHIGAQLAHPAVH